MKTWYFLNKRAADKRKARFPETPEVCEHCGVDRTNETMLCPVSTSGEHLWRRK